MAEYFLSSPKRVQKYVVSWAGVQKKKWCNMMLWLHSARAVAFKATKATLCVVLKHN